MPVIEKEIEGQLFRYNPDTGEMMKWRATNWRGKEIGWELIGHSTGDQGKFDSGGYLIWIKWEEDEEGKRYRKRFLLHRLAYFMMTGEWPEQIDHINGRRSDNRWENLREAPQVDNARNRAIPVTNTSGVMGVYWHKKREHWTAKIRVNDKLLDLGEFKDKDMAVAARKAAEMHYGFHPNHGRNATARLGI